MKKSFILTIFFVTISIFPQPVLNATDIISNFSATTYNANPANFSAGSSGADQVWDYSTIANVPKGTYTSVSSQNTPFVNSFSNPNYFLKATSSTPDIYEIYNLSTIKYETLGQSYDPGVIVNFSPNPKINIFIWHRFFILCADILVGRYKIEIGSSEPLAPREASSGTEGGDTKFRKEIRQTKLL